MERPRTITFGWNATWLLALFMGCTTATETPTSSFDILRPGNGNAIVGEKVFFPAPLPDFYPIIDQEKQTVARGWDMDKDGRLDRIDVLGEGEEVVESYFDFDGDGQVDLKKSFSAAE